MAGQGAERTEGKEGAGMAQIGSKSLNSPDEVRTFAKEITVPETHLKTFYEAGPAAAPPRPSSPRRTIGVVGCGRAGTSAPRHPLRVGF